MSSAFARPEPGSYASPAEAQAALAVALDGRPLAAVIVANRIVGDSRVLKSALSLERLGFQAVLFGLTNKRFRVSHDGASPMVLSPTITALTRTGDPADRRRWADDFARSTTQVSAGLPWSVVLSHDMFAFPAGRSVAAARRAPGSSCFWVHDVHENARGYAGVLDTAQIDAAVAIEDEFFLSPDLIVTVNEALRDELARRHRYAREIAVVYNCPVADGGSTITPIRRRLGLAPDAPLGVYLGRATAARGIDVFPALLARLPALHLAVVTNGPAEPVAAMQAAARRVGAADRLHVLPYVAHDEVTAFVADASFGLSLIASYGNTEAAVPTKILEYAHAGVPVIASAIALQKRFVENHGLGIVVPDATDVAGLAIAVEQTLAAGPVAAASVRRIAETYEWHAQFAPLGRVLAARAAPLFPDLPAEGPRIFQGPALADGQPGALAAGLRQRGARAAAVSVTQERGDGHAVDHVWATPSLDEMAALTQWTLEHFDVLHYHSQPIMRLTRDGRLAPPSFTDMVKARLAGKRVVFSLHGAEARLHADFARRSPYAWTAKEEHADVLSDAENATFVRIVRELANVVTVADPELADYAPGAVILPRAVDTRLWTHVGSVSERRPVVVHAPSHRGVTGTEHVLRAVETLKGEGIDFEFRLIEGLDAAATRAACAPADVIVDQLRTGWHGARAVEGMALGKVVLAFIRDDLAPRLEAPIVNANPVTIAAELRRVLRDPALRRDLGARGRDFCERHHDSRVVAGMLRDLYEGLPVGPLAEPPTALLEMMREGSRAMLAAAIPPAARTEAERAAPARRPSSAAIPSARMWAMVAPAGGKHLFAPPYGKILPRLLRRLGLAGKR